jgi:hypothetical protein
VQLVHDLALGDLTCRQIGEKYGRAEQTIYNFANENKPEIEAVREDIHQKQ